MTFKILESGNKNNSNGVEKSQGNIQPEYFDRTYHPFGLAYAITSFSVIVLSARITNRSTTFLNSRMLPVQLIFCNSFIASLLMVFNGMLCSSQIFFRKCSANSGISSLRSFKDGT